MSTISTHSASLPLVYLINRHYIVKSLTRPSRRRAPPSNIIGLSLMEILRFGALLYLLLDKGRGEGGFTLFLAGFSYLPSTYGICPPSYFACTSVYTSCSKKTSAPA